MTSTQPKKQSETHFLSRTLSWFCGTQPRPLENQNGCLCFYPNQQLYLRCLRSSTTTAPVKFYTSGTEVAHQLRYCVTTLAGRICGITCHKKSSFVWPRSKTTALHSSEHSNAQGEPETPFQTAIFLEHLVKKGFRENFHRAGAR